MMKGYLIWILILLSLAPIVRAQEVEQTPEVTPDVDETSQVAKAWYTIQRDTYLVGELVHLKLILQMPSKGVNLVTWPELPLDWPPFEILALGELTDTVDGDFRQFEQSITAVVWQPGTHVTPDTFIAYQIEGDEVFNLPVLPVTVIVPTVLDGVDFNMRPYQPPFALFFISPLVILTGGIGVVYSVRRLKKYRNRPRPVPEQILTPLENAIKQLLDISRLKLPVATLYAAVADCLRSYIYIRFEIAAPDMTTGELLTILETNLYFPERLLRELHHLLEHADLVKFARAQPSPSAGERLLKVARAWLERVEAAYAVADGEESA